VCVSRTPLADYCVCSYATRVNITPLSESNQHMDCRIVVLHSLPLPNCRRRSLSRSRFSHGASTQMAHLHSSPGKPSILSDLSPPLPPLKIPTSSLFLSSALPLEPHHLPNSSSHSIYFNQKLSNVKVSNKIILYPSHSLTKVRHSITRMVGNLHNTLSSHHGKA
jgi:hypothetical protein